MLEKETNKIYFTMKKVTIFFIIFHITSCTNDKWRNIKIISPNKLDTISVITIDNKRYIFNGSSDKIPKNHALIDISNVSELGDEIAVCWGKKG